MKNPWMSLWLSAANKAVGTSRGLWMAEAQRQQQRMLKEMTKAWTAPAGPKRAPAKRRAK